MIVTRIERQRRHPRRVDLFLDNDLAFGLHEVLLLKANIRIGDSLDPATVGSLKIRGEIALAKERALRLISFRLRSEQELRLALLEREFLPDVVATVLDELRTEGIVNDRRFASAFIRDARLRMPTGPAMLVQKLRLKGVDRKIIEESLRENLPVETERKLVLTTAMNLLRRYKTSRKPIPPRKLEQRVAQYLTRRGFAWDTIRPVIRELFASSEQPE